MGRWLAVAFMLLLAAPAWAQGGRPLQVRGIQGLTFGTVLAGVPWVVPRTDVANTAQFEIRGERQAEVLVTFLLPVALTGPGTAALPLSFGPADGGYSPDDNIARASPFDPHVPNPVVLPTNGRGTVYLGGTVSPPPSTPAGAYTATLTLTVAYTGN